MKRKPTPRRASVSDESIQWCAFFLIKNEGLQTIRQIEVHLKQSYTRIKSAVDSLMACGLVQKKNKQMAERFYAL